MATTKKKTTTIRTAPVTAEVAPVAVSPDPAPVENRSGHRHVYQRVHGLGTGETIDVCAICADVKKV